MNKARTNEYLDTLVGKCIQRISAEAANVWYVEFDDGEVAVLDSGAGAYQYRDAES